MSLQPPHFPSPANTPDIHTQIQVQVEEERRKVREEVENRLSQLAQDLYELEICAGAVVKGQEDRIPNYMKRINEQFLRLHSLSLKMQSDPESGRPGDSVPKQVVENVDGFRNPHTYTKNALSRATGENQYALGRILGLESFRRQLHEALGEEMPDVPLPPRRHQPIRNSADTDGQTIQETKVEAGQVNGEPHSVHSDERVKAEPTVDGGLGVHGQQAGI